MSPLELAIRAACRFMGVDPDSPEGAWKNFHDVGKAAAEAFVDALPPELRLLVRRHLDNHPGDPR